MGLNQRYFIDIVTSTAVIGMPQMISSCGKQRDRSGISMGENGECDPWTIRD